MPDAELANGPLAGARHLSAGGRNLAAGPRPAAGHVGRRGSRTALVGGGPLCPVPATGTGLRARLPGTAQARAGRRAGVG